jgi:uncharacterized protein (DUF2384 family)
VPMGDRFVGRRSDCRPGASPRSYHHEVSLAEVEQTGVFWQESGALFETFCELVEELSRSTNVSAAFVRRVVETAERIPETPVDLADMDPYLRTSLLTAVVHSQSAASRRERSRLLIELERARQAMRDIVDERPVWRGGPRDAARWLVEDARIPKADIERLLDISPTTLRRWLDPDDGTEPSADTAERAAAVAKIVNHLRHAMTPRGVVMWLQAPHPDLDDRAPIDELKDFRSYQRLIHLAAGARSVGAT